MAVPLPIAILIASNIVGLLGDSTYLFASSAALSKLSLVAVFFELTRYIFAPNGLAGAHFGWPAQATRPLYRGLVLTQVVSLPLFYIAFQLGYSGLRLDSPANFQAFNNSLGRISFVAALLFAGLSILSMLRPEKKLDQSGNDVRVPWPQRFSEYSFSSVFLGAYPIVFLATLVPALLISFGDDTINFELRFVVDFGQGLATKDDVQMSISRAFREKGIEFALPRSEVKLVSGGESDSPKMNVSSGEDGVSG